MSKLSELLSDGPKIINIGLKSFYEAGNAQGILTIHVKWEPPAQGDPELISILEQLL
ncbi:MAG: fdrA domain protein [Promethearchaeota archaeon]